MLLTPQSQNTSFLDKLNSISPISKVLKTVIFAITITLIILSTQSATAINSINHTYDDQLALSKYTPLTHTNSAYNTLTPTTPESSLPTLNQRYEIYSYQTPTLNKHLRHLTANFLQRTETKPSTSPTATYNITVLFLSSSVSTQPNKGLHHYKFRHYSAELGRWPSRDPLGDTAFLQTYIKECNKGEKCAKKREAKLLNLRKESQKNLYVFIDNTPITHYDQHGLVLGWGYGNYCGYSRFGQNGAPIDGVDLACAKHDVCLATPREVFRFKCCNLKFLKAVRKANCRFDLNGKRRAVKDINRCRRAKAVIFGPGGLITLLTLPV